MKKTSFFTTSLFLLTFIFIALFFASCSQEYEPLVFNDDPQSKADSLTSEFEWNYTYLYYYYFYAEKELKDIDSYNITSVSEDAYANIYYMYEQMSDPFTQYFSPKYLEKVISMLTYSEKYIGLGIEVDTNLVVTQVYENSPAEQEGLQRGDLILMIDSVSVQTKTIFDRLIQGELNESIEITIERNLDTLSYNLMVSYITMPTVFLDSIDSIPLIRITEFIDSTSNPGGTLAEFQNALLKTQGADATIIDLRDNPGGSIDLCTSMAAELLNKGDTVIIEMSKNPNTTTKKQQTDTTFYIAKEDGLGQGRYFVFLQNEASASCSEIFISGVTSNTKSPIIGTTSYGKGIGQYYFITYLNGIAAITSFEFYDKAYETYNHYGIIPDFDIEEDSLVLIKAVELAKNKDYERTAQYGSSYKAYAKKAATSISKEKAQNKSGAFKIKYID